MALLFGREDTSHNALLPMGIFEQEVMWVINIDTYVTCMAGKSGQYSKLLDGNFCDFDWKNKEVHKGNMPYWKEIWSNRREILTCLQGI